MKGTDMKIAVFFGGIGVERDVSIAGGVQVLKALRGRGHEALAVDPALGALGPAEEERLFVSRVRPLPPETNDLAVRQSRVSELLSGLRPGGWDAVFLVLHGGAGENGTMQAVLDLAGVPYTGSGRLGSAVAMDKDAAKRLFRAAGVPTPDWLMAPSSPRAVSPQEVAARLGWPVVVKPNKQGSTVGVSVVKSAGRLAAAVAESFRHDDEVMIEAFIAGREFTVGILEDRPLAVGEIVLERGGIFDYGRKYQPNGAREIFPADLAPGQTQVVQELALRAHRACKLRDYSRADFRLDEDGKFWCLELNSLPGMTATSLFPQSAAAAGIPFPELCERICRLAVERTERQRARRLKKAPWSLR
jgi:D-alanine-D-alanine ligase